MRDLTRGAIFDWDGRNLTPRRITKKAGTPCKGYRIYLPRVILPGFGMTNGFIIPNLLNWSSRPEEIRKLSLRIDEPYREILRIGYSSSSGHRMLAELRQHGIRCAIVSSTHRQTSTEPDRAWSPRSLRGDRHRRGRFPRKPDPEVS